MMTPKNQLSIYHRAFKAYLKELETAKADRKLHDSLAAGRVEYKAYLKELEKAEDDPKLRESILAGHTDKEYMDSTRYSCTVETDWIEQIEAALPYLEKAVMENRQFILQNGNTVLIEQAKRISKTSVEHLAHHSELITHAPEPEQDLIPDKIYVVENENNYAIYENRFLYMLLCQLQEFVDTRYSKIIKVWNSFSSDLVMNKKVRFGKRTLKYAISLHEDAEDDPSTSYDQKTQAIIERLRAVQQAITALLNTALMKEVSHAPMLKPPITRTNVLKMDPNFRETVALYDFLMQYQKDGYTIHEIHERIEPFSAEATSDFAEILATLSYLSYRYGGCLEDEMEKQYREEELQLREARDREALEQLAQMKQQITASGKSVEQYLRALEQRNITLEKERITQRQLETQIFEQEQEVRDQKSACHELQISVTNLEKSLKQQKGAMQRQKAQLEQEMQQMKETHRRLMDEKQRQIEEIEEKLTVTSARLLGVRQEHGLITPDDDFTSKERFLELEQEYAAFQKFFAGQWKSAKKQIRKQSLWSKLVEMTKAEEQNTPEE